MLRCDYLASIYAVSVTTTSQTDRQTVTGQRERHDRETEYGGDDEVPIKNVYGSDDDNSKLGEDGTMTTTTTTTCQPDNVV